MYGRIPPNNTAVSTYTIDVASPVTFVNPNSTQDSSRQMFYQSPVLQDGPHILAVNAPDTAVGDPASQFFFDFLTYAPSPLSPTQSTSSSAKSRGVKTILPAVLVPCLVCVILLVLGLFVQRRRKLAALQRKPTPYKIEDGETVYLVQVDVQNSHTCLCRSTAVTFCTWRDRFDIFGYVRYAGQQQQTTRITPFQRSLRYWYIIHAV